MSTGFLITNLSGKLRQISTVVNQYVFKKLYIYVSIDKNQCDIRNTEWMAKKIIDMYSSSFYLFPSLDVRIILNELKLQDFKISKIKDYNVDVILVPKNYDDEKISTLKSCNEALRVVYIDEFISSEEKTSPQQIQIYRNVVLGGTFDRLHTGHKILLSEALLRCSKKLTVGVTDGNMIKGKKLWELIEPCTKRIQEVQTFIKEVDSSINYEIVPIQDMYGPTKSDPYLNMIVVSSETQKGGYKVNEIRKERGLNELDIHIISLAEDSKKGVEEEDKISSSNTRMRLLGTYLKPREPKPNFPQKPYLIGLTGGVASGKSSICEYLKNIGATVIDCDKVAHQLYKPGSNIYEELIKLFGKKIVCENKEINRKELGSIVFSDYSKLHLLNNLMWPAIIKATLEQCQKLYLVEKKEIIILEAAVLLKAGWQKTIHEVWGTIIPQDEAIARVVKRNGLTESEAKLRIDAQSSNSEIVEASNVVFCSLWSYEYTRKQVDKAWKSVQSHVKNL